MFGLGTIINSVAIIIGGVFGLLFGKKLTQSHQDSLTVACGISVLFIGSSGTLEKMMSISEGTIVSNGSMKIVISLAIGAVIGEILNIEDKFEQFGEWLKKKSGNAKDKRFVEGFVTASLTVCIGAMAIVGAIQDGISGDYSILVTKAILDFIIIMVMTCSMGKGAIFSCVPVFLFQGSITLLARLIEPLMNEVALANISLVGNVLIFCVGLNLVWGKKVRVANFLPALVIAVLFAFIPFQF
ncbi:MAG: DUF554 domain-containing protein [Erysipelotrichaceae bacterium]|nr:DUF554 domain-containing protein [Erysipelotrichaceae bacterium]